MNRKILSIAVLFLAAMMVAPLAQARDGRDDWNGRDNHGPVPVYRENHVERHYSHPGQHRGWRTPRHRHHYHYRPAPRHHHYHGYHPARRAHWSMR